MYVMYVSMYVCMYVFVHVCMYVRTHVCTYVRMHVHLYVCRICFVERGTWIHISLSLYSRNSPGNELGSWLLWQHGDADGISQDLSHYSSSLSLLNLTIPSLIPSLAFYLSVSVP